MTFTPCRTLILFLLCTTILSVLNPTTRAAPVILNDSKAKESHKSHETQVLCSEVRSTVSNNQGLPSGISDNLNGCLDIHRQNEGMSEDSKRPCLEEIGGQGLYTKHTSELRNVPDPGDNKSCTPESISSQRSQFLNYMMSQFGDERRSQFVDEIMSQFDTLVSQDIPAGKILDIILEQDATEDMDQPQQQQQEILSVPDPVLDTSESISSLRAKLLEAFGLSYDAIFGVDSDASFDVDMDALIQHHQQLRQPISSDSELQITGNIAHIAKLVAHIAKLFLAGASVSPHSESESAMSIMIQQKVSEIHELILAEMFDAAIKLKQELSALDSNLEDMLHLLRSCPL